MRKILVGIAFFCFLSFAQGVRTVQAAVMDVSDNFVSLKVDKREPSLTMILCMCRPSLVIEDRLLLLTV